MTQERDDRETEQPPTPSSLVESMSVGSIEEDSQEQSQSILKGRIPHEDTIDSDNSVDEDLDDDDDDHEDDVTQDIHKPSTSGQKSKGKKTTPSNCVDGDEEDASQQIDKPSTSGQKRKTASKSGRPKSFCYCCVSAYFTFYFISCSS